MAHAKILVVPASGFNLKLSFDKYSEKHVAAESYPPTEVRRDMLVLSEGRTFNALVSEAQAAFNAQNGSPRTTLIELQNQAAYREFGMTFEALFHARSEALRQRYAAAHSSNDRKTKLDELRACARQGHVQANMDVGLLLREEQSHECAHYFGEAHNLGHPKGLFELSKPLVEAGDTGSAVRVLLLGAFCGSFTCVQALLATYQHSKRLLETPACLAALEEGRAYDSIHAKYLLGCVFLHGVSCRDEARGIAMIHEAAAVRSFRGGDKGKVPLISDKTKFHAGTLSHMERLIDDELRAIRSKEFQRNFVAEAAKLLEEPSEANRAAMLALMQKYDPASERTTRRLDRLVNDWLTKAENEPADEAKLARMAALAIKDEPKSDDNA